MARNTKPAAPSIDAIAAAVAAVLAGKAPATQPDAKPQQQAAKSEPAVITFAEIHTIGKVYKTSGGNDGVAVRGKTADGRNFGGNLWIK